MFRSNMANVSRMASCGLQAASLTRATASRTTLSSIRAMATPATRLFAVPRFLSTTASRTIAILEKDEKPKESTKTQAELKPTNITEEQYHQLADEYLETILNKFEEIQDAREDVDVEFSAGVLTVNFGPDVGTYVINKQPPNKQIWLSSPKTGPKRYDWVVLGEGQSDKQGTAIGEWMYIRDGSTLNKIFYDELGVDLGLSTRRFSD